MQKACTKCLKIKVFSEFGIRSGGKLMSWCRECKREYERYKWKKDNQPEEIDESFLAQRNRMIIESRKFK
jgi:hypothetical protein